MSETGRDPVWCASAVLQDEPYVLPDALKGVLASGKPLVDSKLGLRFYADTPITTTDGHRLGAVNVLDTRPRAVTPARV